MKAVHVLQDEGEHAKSPRYLILHHDVIPDLEPKEGYVRTSFKFSPLVCLERSGGSDVTAFASLDMGGHFPTLLQAMVTDG